MNWGVPLKTSATAVISELRRSWTLASGAPQSRAHVLENRLDFLGVFRADFAAFENLAAERVHAHQHDTASFFAGAVDVQYVAAPNLHVCSQHPDALAVNDLEVGDELPGEVADRARRNVKPMETR